MAVQAPSAALPRPVSRQRMMVIAAALIGLCLGLGLLVRTYVFDFLVQEAAQRGNATLNFHAETFEGALDKYRILPALFSRRADIRQMVRDAATPSAAAESRAASPLPTDLFGEHAALTGAHAIAVSDGSGRVFAASRSDLPDLAIGARIAGQAHFATALDGRLGRQSMVAPDGSRLYLFSYALRPDPGVLGVVTVAVNLERIERPWTLVRDILLAADAGGRIILANRPELRLRALAGKPPPAEEDYAPLVIAEGGRDRLVRLSDRALSGRFVISRRRMPVLDWTMVALGETVSIERRAALAGGLAGTAALLVATVLLFILQGRRNLAQKLRDDRAMALRLERLVRDRTKDLLTTRGELIQAAKLAALGQMSAAMAHEFNQPLAAMRSNADNAETLIRRGEAEKAIDNLVRLRSLVDRLGATSRSLKTFARKPRSQLRPVSLRAVCDAALLVLQPRRRETGVEIAVNAPGGDVQVLAGAVRMEQVIVNLVANAIDAAAEKHPGRGGRVEIEIAASGAVGEISVRDNGAGIQVSPKETVFDPFVTTKEAGDGLGLGLSITYNIVKDFSGTIAVDDAPGGGAMFSVRLPLAGDGPPGESASQGDAPVE